MAQVIQPDEQRSQAKGDQAIYELPWDTWDADLAKQQRDRKAQVTGIRGSACSVQVLPDDRARRVARLLVKAPLSGGYFEITHTVTTKSTPPESRRRSFRVLVE